MPESGPQFAAPLDVLVEGTATAVTVDGVDVGPGGQVDLGDDEVEITGQPGGEVGDVAPGVGHPADHRGDDAGAVAAVHGQHPGRAAGRCTGLLGHLPDGHRERPVVGQRRQRGLDLRGRGVAGAEQHHREVPAQQRHGGVLEVEPEAGQPTGGLGDDAGPVVAEDGDGVEGAHAGIVARVAARPSTSSSIGAVSRPVAVLCWLGW